MGRIRSALLALPLVLSLAACGAAAADGAAGVLSLADASGAPAGASGSGTGAADPSRSPGASIDPRDAMLAFARCMREHGVEMADPQPGAGGGFSIRIDGPKDADAGPIAEADEACRPLLVEVENGLGKTFQMSPEDQQQFLDFAQCMRDQGIDFPDPGPVKGDSAGGDGEGEVAVGVKIDPEDPAWQAANEECKHLMPGRFGAAGEEDAAGASPAPSSATVP